MRSFDAMAYDDSGRQNHTYGNNGPGAVLNTISFVGIVLGFFLILNRLYWRWKKGTPGVDDVIIVFAWLGLVALGIVTYVAVDYGYGRLSSTLTREEASNAIRMFYVYQVFYKLSLNSSKLSILTLYLRVFDTRDWFGRITKFLIFLVLTYTFSIIFANVFICNPISTYWNTSLESDSSRKDAKCINILGYWYASSLYNILSECLMLLSVLVRIWTLPSRSQPPILQLRQKINLTIVLGLGVFTVITAILRVTTLNQAAQQADKTGGTLISTIWSSVEACLGLCIANLPMLRQLLRWRGWCGGRWFSSTAGKSRGEHSRHRSEYTPAAQSGHASSRQRSRRPTTGPDASTSAGEIHMQRDFRRGVIPTPSVCDDLEAQRRDFRHVEFQSLTSASSPCHSPSKTHKARTNGSSVEVLGGGGSKTPSIASTLRSPTSSTPIEPLPMVRISTEPNTSHCSLQSAVLPPAVVQAHFRDRDE